MQNYPCSQTPTPSNFMGSYFQNAAMPTEVETLGACSKSFLSSLYFTLRICRILVGGTLLMLKGGSRRQFDGRWQHFDHFDSFWFILGILFEMKIDESIDRWIDLWSIWSFLKLVGIVYLAPKWSTAFVSATDFSSCQKCGRTKAPQLFPPFSFDQAQDFLIWVLQVVTTSFDSICCSFNML